MKNQSQPESKPSSQSEGLIDDACILDIDFFVKTLSGIKSKGVCPDLIASIITHYAAKWLPDDLSSNDAVQPQSVVAVSWMKKRFFVETLIGVLPREKTSIPCDFLLRLLRTANMVGVGPTSRRELEKRISWRLEEASLKELMIPSFGLGRTCGTALDVEVVIRLVKGFVGLDGSSSSEAAMLKVAKLVDFYLAEAAMDANLSLCEFVTLASALPAHARATDDGLYRAVDTYLKVHPGLSKQERKGLCRLIDSGKLTLEASLHAAQNERLPVRAVIQVLFSEQTKLLTRHMDRGLEQPARCVSKREMMNGQQMEMKKLREDVVRLEGQCNALQVQMERMMVEKKTKKMGGMFKWRRKLGMSKSVMGVEKKEEGDDGDDGVEEERETPMDMKARLVKGRRSHKWRRSIS
ncbi:root phototropism protein 3-like [Senna tora]|uniref:Root phototropism protein 3-like n=1 Tax=Senna tora TaxID=362788 RepID=A0A834T2Z8_9FABA|nr:root phototropism protein 3-like [Senna tora]